MAHTHAFTRELSHPLDDPANPHVLRGCASAGCTATSVVCLLCEEDGGKRRHARHTKGADDVLEAIEWAHIGAHLREADAA